MATQNQIQELFEEAIGLSKYSKSKVKVKFWHLVNKLEKLLSDSAGSLGPEQRSKLNAAKKKFC